MVKLTKKQIKEQAKQELIFSILNKHFICSICGFTYALEELNTMTMTQLKSIFLNGESKIFEHDRDCFNKYKHDLKYKKCECCGADILRTNSSNICKECAWLESHTRTCSICGEMFVVESNKCADTYCNNCFLSDKVYEIQNTHANQIEYVTREICITNEKYLTDLFFNKFFNEGHVKGTIEYAKLKVDKFLKIKDTIKRFICHISNAVIEYNWKFDDVRNIIVCLINCQKEIDGYCISTNNQNNIDYATALPGWKYVLNNTFEQVIKIMNNFKINETDGKGEVFLSIINTQIIFNSKKHADVLYKDNTLAEVKLANNASTCGRLLFKRDNWFGYNSYDTYYNVVMNNLNTFFILNNLKINLAEFFPNVHYMSHNSGYSKLIDYVKSINKNIANKLIQYLFYMTIDKEPEQFDVRFADLDLTDKNNFKIFHFVNYCLYYILEDAKSEQLDKLIFIADTNVLTLNKNDLLLMSIDSLNEIIKSWDVAYPEPGFTKKDNTSHDRNKDRAPGIYYNKTKGN